MNELLYVPLQSEQYMPIDVVGWVVLVASVLITLGWWFSVYR